MDSDTGLNKPFDKRDLASRKSKDSAAMSHDKADSE
jgi:hypothetical protein